MRMQCVRSWLTSIRCPEGGRRKRVSARISVVSLAILAGALPALADCRIPEGQEERLAQVQRLALQTHSADQMNCAADTAIAAAAAAPDSVEVHALALGTLSQAIDLLSSLKRADLMGVDTALIARIQELSQAGLEVGVRARALAPDSPDIKLLHALLLVVSSPWLEVEQSVATVREAMTLLSAVVDEAPDTLGGLAQTVLGRIYFELPPLLGGDLARSVALLEDAVKRNPANIQALRYLAESYDQELEEARSTETLHLMVPLEPGPGEYQLFADEWRLAQGLAGRLHATELRDALAAKRQALLEVHPELLTRESTAVGGHGGDNPLSGTR